MTFAETLATFILLGFWAVREAAYAQGSLLDLAQPVPEQQGLGI